MDGDSGSPGIGGGFSYWSVLGRGAGRAVMGVGMVLLALCKRMIGDHSVASALGTHWGGSGSWVAPVRGPDPNGCDLSWGLILLPGWGELDWS